MCTAKVDADVWFFDADHKTTQQGVLRNPNCQFKEPVMHVTIIEIHRVGKISDIGHNIHHSQRQFKTKLILIVFVHEFLSSYISHQNFIRIE